MKRADKRVGHTRISGVRNPHYRHGQVGTKEYRAWKAMNTRCTNPKQANYKNYGGRGITVAECWRNDFAAFLAHIGPAPSDKHSVDRIKNTIGYEPGNVRWATRREQSKNSRRVREITFRGETHHLSEWARLLGSHVLWRIGEGWSVERAFTQPLQKQRKP